jgi:hypothetical protein
VHRARNHFLNAAALRLVRPNPSERAPRSVDEEALKKIDRATQAVLHAIDETSRRQEELARIAARGARQVVPVSSTIA